MSEDFGFTVKRGRSWNYDTNEQVIEPGQWCVSLPHQCDSWDIAGEGSADRGVTHAEAVAGLEAFIVEAQQALEALKAESEVRPDEDQS